MYGKLLQCYFHAVHIAIVPQRTHKRLVSVYITFTIAFRIGSERAFMERLVLVKTFS